MMRRSNKKVFDIIFVSCFTTNYPTATTTLCPVFIHRCSFNVSKMRDSDNNIFFFDQVFYFYFIVEISYFCFAGITKFFFDLLQFLFDDIKSHSFICQQFIEMSNQFH